MNRFILESLTLLLAVVLVGCGRKSTDSAKTEEAVVFGPQHSAKKGLLVPEDTRESLGLRIVEVAEEKVPAKFEIQLRVYEVGKSSTLASGMVSPEKAQLLKAGQVVEVRTREGKSVSAKVVRVSDQLQKATGAMELLVQMPQAAEEFKVGAFVQASVTLASSESVVTIPRAALLQCSDGHSVYTVSGEHLIRTPIKIGNASTELVEVKDGLYAGDKVVLQPVMSLWMTELAAVKGGQACCVEPPKGKYAWFIESSSFRCANERWSSCLRSFSLVWASGRRFGCLLIRCRTSRARRCSSTRQCPRWRRRRSRSWSRCHWKARWRDCQA